VKKTYKMPFQGHGAATVKAEEMLFQKKKKTAELHGSAG
jgi:hypothetical protein